MLEYSDVYIIPQYSNVTSRKEVNTSSILDPKLDSTEIKVPVISANMDTVTDGHMALKIAEGGALGAIHRFMSIQDNVIEWKKTVGFPSLVSVGVTGDAKERTQALYEAGARHFIIDIAHGHHKLMKEMIEYIKSNFDKTYVMAGNVATAEGAADLIQWGADAIKVGIGPGTVCTTKNVTGVTIPQFSAVVEAAKTAKKLDPNVVVVADGGVREIGDIAKALGAGADFVMMGRMFASCPEAPQPGVYRGMASLDAMKTIRTSEHLPTPEGKTMALKTDKHVNEVVELIQGGLRSAFSYSNSLTLKEFQAKCKFGLRK